MKKITVGQAKTIAVEKGLSPGLVKGTDGVQFTKGTNSKIEVISWEKLEEILTKKGLAVFESNGWMKIMKNI